MASGTETISHRPARLAAAVIAVLTVMLLGLAAVLPATATPPFALPDQITDQIGAVEGETATIRAALEDLEVEHGIRMWVVFVDSFDGTDPQAWAEETFTATRLGPKDYLLAVAMGDREYGYVVDDAFALPDAALTRVATAAERHLAENPARAVTEASAVIASASSADSGTSQRTLPSWTPAAVLGGFAAFLALLGVGRVRHGLPFLPETVSQMLHEMRTSPNGRGEDTWTSHGGWGGGSSGGGGGTRGGSGSF